MHLTIQPTRSPSVQPIVPQTLIGITNHGVTVWSNDPNELRVALAEFNPLPFADDSSDSRGIPESALHD